jgi:ABC-type uncharacterized transport system permease subunit
MTSFFAGSAIVIYLFAFGYQVSRLRKHSNTPTAAFQLTAALAIILHGAATYGLLFSSAGLDLSLLKICALISLVINVVLFFSGLKKPIHSLFLFLFPISALSLFAATTTPSTKAAVVIPPTIEAHVLISILAYSTLAIAALQALLIGYQNWQLKHKHQNLLMRTFPPLQSMEALLFELVWAGEILLTMSLVSGFLFYENFFTQQLLHKVVFSMVAWVFYGCLLWGRHFQGWRGNTAIRWTWAGFIAILLGYIGSKVALEFLLV